MFSKKVSWFVFSSGGEPVSVVSAGCSGGLLPGLRVAMPPPKGENPAGRP